MAFSEVQVQTLSGKLSAKHVRTRQATMPVWYRRGSRVCEDIVIEAWPELSDYRINDHLNFLND